jgi:oligopeptide/dipeptide ABC transporter ATP-binding protein
VPPIAELQGLAVAFPRGGGWTRVVDGVSLTVEEGETVGLVGESGCGKSIAALALVRLVPEPGRIVSGSVRLVGEDVVAADERRLCALRGAVAGFLFQEPAQALDPVRAVGWQVSEAARIHLALRAAPAAALARELLVEVGLERPDDLARAYPHQLSGGQRQRVLLACALAARPRLLIADEPTTALDTVSQKRFAELLVSLREKRGMAMLFISHDLALVGRLADRVTVLYAGETVEVAPRSDLFGDPLHPYTRALLNTAPRAEGAGSVRPAAIPGEVPRAGEWARGCRFAPRCPEAFERCRAAHPALTERPGGRRVRCFLVSEEEESDARDGR